MAIRAAHGWRDSLASGKTVSSIFENALIAVDVIHYRGGRYSATFLPFLMSMLGRLAREAVCADALSLPQLLQKASQEKSTEVGKGINAAAAADIAVEKFYA